MGREGSSEGVVVYRFPLLVFLWCSLDNACVGVYVCVFESLVRCLFFSYFFFLDRCCFWGRAAWPVLSCPPPCDFSGRKALDPVNLISGALEPKDSVGFDEYKDLQQ